MEQEKTLAGKDAKVDVLRAEKEVALQDMIKKIVKKELKKSKRKDAIALAREKNTVDEEVKVELISTQLSDDCTAKLMRVVRKHAKDLLKVGSLAIEAVMKDAVKEFENYAGNPISMEYTHFIGTIDQNFSIVAGHLFRVSIKIGNAVMLNIIWMEP